MLKRRFKIEEAKLNACPVKFQEPTPVIDIRNVNSNPSTTRLIKRPDCAPYPGAISPPPRPLFRLQRNSLAPEKAIRTSPHITGSRPAIPRAFAPLSDDSSDDTLPKFNEKGEQLFCVCRKPYNPRTFMIGCDECDDWFHGKCVRIPANVAKTLEKYVCPRCIKRANNRDRKRSRMSDGPQPHAKRASNPKPEPSCSLSSQPTPSELRETALENSAEHNDSNHYPIIPPSTERREENDSNNSSPPRIHSPPRQDSASKLLLTHASQQFESSDSKAGFHFSTASANYLSSN